MKTFNHERHEKHELTRQRTYLALQVYLTEASRTRAGARVKIREIAKKWKFFHRWKFGGRHQWASVDAFIMAGRLYIGF